MMMTTMQDTFPKPSNPSRMYPASILHLPSQAIENAHGKNHFQKSVVRILYPSCTTPTPADPQSDSAWKSLPDCDSDIVNLL